MKTRKRPTLKESQRFFTHKTMKLESVEKVFVDKLVVKSRKRRHRGV